MSEMAYAVQVVRGKSTEMALLRKHDDEACFGVQIAAGKPELAVKAGKIAVERGAAFVDLNCGCPIHDVVRRGMGATLLQRPEKLGRIVEAMAAELEVPVTVKIRLGWNENELNASEVARIVEESGAAALAVHGRTREQRYSKKADWSWIARLVEERSIPVIGNGDVLTWYEAEDLKQQSQCASLMLGRGALIKPWLFQEIAEGRAFEPTAEERVGIYMQFMGFLKQHFRDDAKGRKRTMFFLPWHLGFFCRYRPLPAERYREQSRQHPLLQTRYPDDEQLPVLEQLLRDPREELHEQMAAALWGAEDQDDAVARFVALAEANPPVRGDAGEVATAHG